MATQRWWIDDDDDDEEGNDDGEWEMKGHLI